MSEVRTEDVRMPSPAGDIAGFLARPAAPHGPAVIVIQEWWGLNDHIKDVTRRLAGEGFLALAPDLYDGRVTRDPAVAGSLMGALDHPTGLRKIQAAADYLNNQHGASRVGVIGFCMGGTFSLLSACQVSAVRAAVPFYGQVPELDSLQNLHAPVMYVYAGMDQWITRAEVDRLESFLRSTGRPGEVVRYAKADHAFFNDTRPDVYSAADAADAWSRSVDFLKKNLAA